MFANGRLTTAGLLKTVEPGSIDQVVELKTMLMRLDYRCGEGPVRGLSQCVRRATAADNVARKLAVDLFDFGKTREPGDNSRLKGVCNAELHSSIRRCSCQPKISAFNRGPQLGRPNFVWPLQTGQVDNAPVSM